MRNPIFGSLAALVISASAQTAVTPLLRSKDSVRVSVAQMNITETELTSGKDRVDALLPWMDKAVGEKADLLVFPEYLLGPFHLPDPLIEKLSAEVKKRKINVIVGGWEYKPGAVITHPPAPQTYSNAVLVLDREGKIAGKHRKMHSAVGAASAFCWPPAPDERGEQTMLLGEENGVVDLDFGRIGLLTCYDGYFFEMFMMPSLRGAEVLVWVNSRGGMVEPHIIQAASFITCTHVVASNTSNGCGSAICSYPGWRLDAAAPQPGSEALITASLDLKELRNQRLNNRMLHQRRPEAYKTLTEKWEPWKAYPDLKPFAYPSVTTSSN
jgi:predicted amidohydrolase